MSILGTIRRNLMWLMFVLIGLGMLGFLLMDATSGQGNVLSGANGDLGKVNGKKITAQVLQAKMNELKQLFPRASDEEISETAWTDLTEQQVFAPRYKSLGIGVSDLELAELIKSPNPHRFTRQMFAAVMGEGGHDAAKVQALIDDADPQTNAMVNQLEYLIAGEVLNNKYVNALRHGVNIPDWVAKTEMVKEYKTIDFDYIMLPYSLVKDEEIKVEEADIRAYAAANKGKYTAKEGVSFDYVAFPKIASKEDTTQKMVALQTLREKFAEIPAERDSLYAASNSSLQVDPRTGPVNPGIGFHTKETLKFNDEWEDKIFAAEQGDVVGPFEFQGAAYLVKVLEKRTNIPDSARVRHILINAQAGNPLSFAQAQSTADSLVTELKKNKSKFDDYVTEFSGDTASVPNGGVYDYFPQGQMVSQFNAAAFYNGSIGEITTAPTLYGVHIVEPLGRKGRNTGVKLAVIAQPFAPSKTTTDKLYSDAKDFERNGQTAESFAENAKQFGGVKTAAKIAPDAQFIPGLGAESQVINWANNARLGDVKYFSLAGQSIVARLTSKTKNGELDIENNRPAIINEVRKEKKADILKKRIADAGGVTADMQGLATKLDRTVQRTADAKFANSGTTVGFEPEVISKLFFLNAGDITNPLNGRRGVYVVKVNQFGTVPNETDFTQYKTTARNSMLGKASMQSVTAALKEKGILKDERYKFR